MGFNGTIPGPVIVVHEGDYAELTLGNAASNAMGHNIDFHASTGAKGGGSLTLAGPGQQVKLRWKATKAGTSAYHRAPGGAMIPYRVVAWMNGAVVMLPRDGLRDASGEPMRYDRGYYIGEQDSFIPRDAEGKIQTLRRAHDGDERRAGSHENADPYVHRLQRQVGALTGEHAMQASFGKTVLFIHS